MTSKVGKTTRREHRLRKPKWDIRVRLIVAGFADDPDELTKFVGVEPTEVKRRGDEVSWGHAVSADAQVPKVKSNFWILETPSDRTDTLTEQTRALLNAIAPVAANLRQLPDESKPTISCAIYDYSREVVLEFPRDVVEGAAAIGADIDVDYYDLSSTNEEATDGA